MRLNYSIVGTLFAAELRMVLRDRRILFSSVILPLLITPLMFLGSNWSIKHREKRLSAMQYRFCLAGPESGALRSWVTDAANFKEKPDPTGASSTEETGRSHRRAHRTSTRNLRFEEAKPQDPMAALNRGEVHLVLEMASFGASSSALTNTHGSPGTSEPTRSHVEPTQEEVTGEKAVPGLPVVRLIYRANQDESAAAMTAMAQRLERVRRGQRSALLQAHGLPALTSEVTETDVASPAQVAGSTLGRSLTLLVLLFILTSGAVVATDSIAGEKERGTLETMLSTSVNRLELLTAKTLVILAIALVITFIQAMNLLVYVGLQLIPVAPNLAAAVSPGVAALLLGMFLPVAALAASGLLLISGYARSYREAQMYFLPALLLGLVPALAPFLPGVPLRSVLVFFPVANIALAVKEILVGTFDWPMIGISWLVTASTAVWTTRLGVRFLSNERLVTAADRDSADLLGGLALFERHVWRWFAVLWAALLIMSNYFETAELRVQITINLVGLFFGGSCLMLWRYRLDPRQALALRMPRPAVWLGVLFAVPGGLLTSLGLVRLVNLVMPTSTRIAESFNENVVPPGISLAQLLFFVAVMPGLFEEIAFRGLLLHGLHRRLHPAMVALVVGLVFGFFHVALFRLVPTACLGVMFASVTLLSGSIFPAMLWHGLSNATSILLYRFQIPESELPAGCYLAGAGMLAVSFWIFWRNRTPYPGLRTGRTTSNLAC